MPTYPIYPGRRPTVGVLATWQLYDGTLPHSYLHDAYRGFYTAAQEADCHLLLACGLNRIPSLSRPAWPVITPDADFLPIGAWNTDGLLIFSGRLSEPQAEYCQNLVAMKHPTVFITRGADGPTVAVDGASGVRQAIEHLVAHGHRQIAFLAAYKDHYSDGQERYLAYLAATRDLGLAQDPRLIADGDFTMPGGERAMRQILDTGVEFSAVLASNDEMAIGAMDVLRAAGRRIPADVAVIGFDDRPHAKVQEPPLTTIRQPIFEMGQRALWWLLERIEGRDDGSTMLLFPSQLIIRESCGCLPGMTARAGEVCSVTSRREQLVEVMSQAVLTETMVFTAADVRGICAELVETLAESIGRSSLEPFWPVFQITLRRIQAHNDDVYGWQRAFLLAEKTTSMAQERGAGARRQFAEELFRRIYLTLSDNLRRQYGCARDHQAGLADQLGRMTMHLAMALEEGEVLRSLAEWLPRLGVRSVQVCAFEEESDDPVAWSRCVLITASNQSISGSYRLPSRYFAVKECGNTSKAVRMVVLPLVIPEMPPGFVAFETDDLQSCAAITLQLASALRSAKLYRELREANQAKSRFFSMLSHELRTPLTLIGGLSDMLLLDDRRAAGALSDRVRSDIEHIHASAQHLGHLLGDVLDLASSDAYNLRLECEFIDVTEMLSIVVMTGERLCATKGLRWEVLIPASLPPLWGDRTRLCQVALNLVSNAVKYTDQGTVVCRVEVADQWLSFSISDTGIGVRAGEHERIFDEFYRSERRVGGQPVGLGLGLAISRRLIELHGGVIGVHSPGAEGVGSTFYFTLPLTHPEDTPLADDPAMPGLPAPWGREWEAGPGDAGRAARKTIVIVDDDRTLLQMHLRMIQSQSADYEVLSARNGTEALELMQARQPDLILLDLLMPDMDGFAVLDAMRATPTLRHIAVIVLTAQELTETEMARLDRGVITVLIKGMFTTSEILQHVEAAMTQERGQGGEAQRIVRKGMAYMHACYAEHLTRGRVAHHIGVSERHLTRCFREELGVTPMAYLNRYRVTRAKELLLTTALTINEIALAVGFADNTHFNHVFRKDVGCSPGTFRRQRTPDSAESA